jgi:hypothetical protein
MKQLKIIIIKLKKVLYNYSDKGFTSEKNLVVSGCIGSVEAVVVNCSQKQIYNLIYPMGHQESEDLELQWCHQSSSRSTRAPGSSLS